MSIDPGYSYRIYTPNAKPGVTGDLLAGVWNNSDTRVKVDYINLIYSSYPFLVNTSLDPGGATGAVRRSVAYWADVFRSTSYSGGLEGVLTATDTDASISGISIVRNAQVSSYTTITKRPNTSIFSYASQSPFALPISPPSRLNAKDALFILYDASDTGQRLVINEGQCVGVVTASTETNFAHSKTFYITLRDTSTDSTYIVHSDDATWGSQGVSPILISNNTGSGKTLEVLRIDCSITSATNSLSNATTTSMIPPGLRLIRGYLSSRELELDPTDESVIEWPMRKLDTDAPDLDVIGINGPMMEKLQYYRLDRTTYLDITAQAVSGFEQPVSGIQALLTHGYVSTFRNMSGLIFRGSDSGSFTPYPGNGLSTAITLYEEDKDTAIILNPTEMIAVSAASLSEFSSVQATLYNQNTVMGVEIQVTTVEDTPSTSSGISAPTYGWM